MSENLPIKRRRSALRDSPEIRERIIAGISEGIPLAVICREDGMPSVTTVWNWEQEDRELSESIARARLIGFDAIAAEALRIADTPVIGEEITDSKDGRTIKRADMLGHRKLQVETRLKLLAKWDPKRYGDRPEIMIQNNNSNAGGMIELRPEQDEALQRVIHDAQERVRKIT